MSTKLIRGGIVLLDPESGSVRRVIVLQYNPETLQRSLTPQLMGESGDITEAMRIKGPPVETIKIEVEFDATDQQEPIFQPQTAAEFGVHPMIAAIESMIYPDSGVLDSNEMLSNLGTLEIAMAMAPLPVFVWSNHRIVPVRFTELSVTEEMYDANLIPIRAKVSLGMRVLTVNDLPSGHKGASLYMSYHRNKEKLAKKMTGSLTTLGLKGSL